MSFALVTRNVNTALPEVLRLLDQCGEEAPSRNGPVIRLPLPLALTYTHPTERVLCNPLRDANPFFHYFESMWMLAGRADVATPARFVPRIADYSDDKRILHGAYGARWNNDDQLVNVIERLKKDPTTRRAVLALYQPIYDSDYEGKDMPCNTTIYFTIRRGALDMTVCNRSNDIIWGMLGANVVHFSILQQFVAEALETPVGVYTQFSNDAHIYTDKYPKDKWGGLAESMLFYDYGKHAFSSPMFDFTAGPAVTIRQIDRFVSMLTDEGGVQVGSHQPTLSGTGMPMYAAWYFRKRNITQAIGWAHLIDAPDWRTACVDWLQRHHKRAAA